MARNNEFIEYLLELLQTTGDVKARPMFGGFGLYFYDASNHCSIMFALVADEVLYFKTDKINDIDFEQRELKAFSYERNGKPLTMSYREAPAETLDDPDKMTLWAGKAIDAAKRCSAGKHRK